MASVLNVDPSGCAGNIVDVHGAAGVEWLKQLPAIMAECAQRWSLAVLPPFTDLSYNYVAPAIRDDGTPVVLKAGVPHPELWGEIEALKLFDGDGMVQLLEADSELGVLLLERLVPGTALKDLNDDDQIAEIAAGIMRRLWKTAPVDHPFTTVAKWASGLQRLHARFAGGYGPFPSALVDRAEILFDDLLQSEDKPVLLHGDMHAGNILKSEREPWLAIDPKGVVGPRWYDAATFLNDQLSGQLTAHNESLLPGILERRAGQLVEILEIDRAELLGWGLAQAVLSGWWSFEDHGRGWERAFFIADLYASFL